MPSQASRAVLPKWRDKPDVYFLNEVERPSA
jgi:hypothetical protein